MIIENFTLIFFIPEIEKEAPQPIDIIFGLLTLSRNGGDQAVKCFEIAKKIKEGSDLDEKELDFVIKKVKRNTDRYPDFAIGQIIKYLEGLKNG